MWRTWPRLTVAASGFLPIVDRETYELEGIGSPQYDWYLPLDRGNVVFWNAG